MENFIAHAHLVSFRDSPEVSTPCSVWWRSLVLLSFPRLYRQTDRHRGRAADSCMLGCRTRRLRERECKTCRDEQRERVSEDRISFCLSPSVRRDLTHCGLVHLSYLPPYLFLSLLLCLSTLSLFHLLTVFPPSLSFGVHPNHTPLQQAQCRSACACVYLRRIISMFDVCQNKGLISFTKN